MRASAAGLVWPLPAEWDDAKLEELLFPAASFVSREPRPVPDWAALHQEYQRQGLTLSLLWQEYKSQHPRGYQYSQCCELYRAWTGKLDPVIRQEHKFAEKMFVDYAGQTMTAFDAVTDETREAQIFSAVLGASNYTYAEAT